MRGAWTRARRRGDGGGQIHVDAMSGPLRHRDVHMRSVLYLLFPMIQFGIGDRSSVIRQLDRWYLSQYCNSSQSEQQSRRRWQGCQQQHRRLPSKLHHFSRPTRRLLVRFSQSAQIRGDTHRNCVMALQSSVLVGLTVRFIAHRCSHRAPVAVAMRQCRARAQNDHKTAPRASITPQTCSAGRCSEIAGGQRPPQSSCSAAAA